ncbi:hypothetical protein FB451DRAFT_106577 [Mycena latifolia]|nr:hypothetical protein FB451DRAFT_106577 [Mycena latifolia]
MYGAAVTPPTSTTTSSAPSGTPGTVAQFGQCGGSGYTGPTGCKTPYVCTVVNAFYYQCLYNVFTLLL